MKLGGHCRVGFENNSSLPDGSVAAGNHQLVEVIASHASAISRELASADIARSLMGFRS